MKYEILTNVQTRARRVLPVYRLDNELPVPYARIADVLVVNGSQQYYRINGSRWSNIISDCHAEHYAVIEHFNL